MKRYLSSPPKKEYPEDVRLVHNFYPGPCDDPGADRPVNEGGFRVWITDEELGFDRRCYCGWLEGREHYGTNAAVDADGRHSKIERGNVVAYELADGVLRRVEG